MGGATRTCISRSLRCSHICLFIHASIYLFIQPLLNTCYAPSIALDCGDLKTKMGAILSSLNRG